MRCCCSSLTLASLLLYLLTHASNLSLFLYAISLFLDRNAENSLQEWLRSNPAELGQALAREVANDSKPFASRQLASIFLKNMLMAQSVAIQKEKYGRWKAIDPQVRNVIKESLLQALRHPTSTAASNGRKLPW
jgi:Importin-beta N-terminal domain